MNSINMPERLLVDDKGAAQMLDMGRSTFREHVRAKRLPQPVRIGGLTRWRVADLRRAADDLASPPTTASTPDAE